MDNTTKIESMAADLHLLAAPLRLIWTLIKVTLFCASFPLLCGLVVIRYALPNFDPFQNYILYFRGHDISALAYPFVVLGALLMLVVDMVLIIAKDLGGLADILLRVPLLGTVFFALASTWWFVVVWGVYRRCDGLKAGGGSSIAIGFTVAMIAGLYVFEYEDSLPPAALMCFATLAAFSPTLLYLLYRALRPTNVRNAAPDERAFRFSREEE